MLWKVDKKFRIWSHGVWHRPKYPSIAYEVLEALDIASKLLVVRTSIAHFLQYMEVAAKSNSILQEL